MAVKFVVKITMLSLFTDVGDDRARGAYGAFILRQHGGANGLQARQAGSFAILL